MHARASEPGSSSRARRIVWLLLIGVASLALAGCTSGSPTPSRTTSPSSSSSAALSRTQFVAQANAICSAELAEVRSIDPGFHTITTIPASVDAYVALLRTTKVEFEKLIAAQPDAGTLLARWAIPTWATSSATESAMRRLKSDAQGHATAAVTRDLHQIAELKPGLEVERFLKSYGLTHCE